MEKFEKYFNSIDKILKNKYDIYEKDIYKNYDIYEIKKDSIGIIYDKIYDKTTVKIEKSPEEILEEIDIEIIEKFLRKKKLQQLLKLQNEKN